MTMTVEERIENAIETRPRIKAVIKAEPMVMEIFRLAASQSCRSERWQMYEILKHVSSKYVGWHATNPDLCNSICYEMVMDALDILLPTPEIDDETLLDADREVVLQQLRDSVTRAFPHIQLPEPRQDDDWGAFMGSLLDEEDDKD